MCDSPTERLKITANDKLFQLQQLVQPLQLDIDDRRLQYLVVQIIASKRFKCCIKHVRMKFYRTFNSIYSRQTSSVS